MSTWILCKFVHLQMHKHFQINDYKNSLGLNLIYWFINLDYNIRENNEERTNKEKK